MNLIKLNDLNALSLYEIKRKPDKKYGKITVEIEMTVGRGAGFRKVRLASWNIGSLTGKSIELVKSLRRRKISIACVQETKWVGAKARGIDGYKIWYSRSIKAKNEVGILVEKELADFVVEVRYKSDRIMAIKVLVGSVFVNVVIVYAPVSYTHLTLPTKRIV